MFRNFNDVQAYVDRHGKAKLVEQLSQNKFSERVENLVLDWMEADGMDDEESFDSQPADASWIATERAELMAQHAPSRQGRFSRWVAGFLGVTAVAVAVLLVAASRTPEARQTASAGTVLKASHALQGVPFVQNASGTAAQR